MLRRAKKRDKLPSVAVGRGQHRRVVGEVGVVLGVSAEDLAPYLRVEGSSKCVELYQIGCLGPLFRLERGGCAAWPVLRAKRDAFWELRARPAAPYTWGVAEARDGADDRGVRVKAERGHR